jgi:hypothetical protein
MIATLIFTLVAAASPRSIEVGKFMVTAIPLALEIVEEEALISSGCLYVSQYKGTEGLRTSIEAGAASMSQFELPLTSLPDVFLSQIDHVARNPEVFRELWGKQFYKNQERDKALLSFFNSASQDLRLVAQRILEQFSSESSFLYQLEEAQGVSPETADVKLSYEEQEWTQVASFEKDVLAHVEDFTKKYDEGVVREGKQQQVANCPHTSKEAFLRFLAQLNAYR